MLIKLDVELISSVIDGNINKIKSLELKHEWAYLLETAIEHGSLESVKEIQKHNIYDWKRVADVAVGEQQIEIFAYTRQFTTEVNDEWIKTAIDCDCSELLKLMDFNISDFENFKYALIKNRKKCVDFLVNKMIPKDKHFMLLNCYSKYKELRILFQHNLETYTELSESLNYYYNETCEINYYTLRMYVEYPPICQLYFNGSFSLDDKPIFKKFITNLKNRLSEIHPDYEIWLQNAIDDPKSLKRASWGPMIRSVIFDFC